MERWCETKRLLAGVLAVAVAMAGTWIPGATAADVNGDRAVDVRDVHAMMAVLFASQTDTARADVNGDGAVDILDFQALFEATQREKPARMPACQQHVPLATLLQGPHLILTAPELRLAAALRGDVEIARPVVHAAPAPVPGALYRTQRYAFRLFPHGPPA